jgi:hypothetical protein
VPHKKKKHISVPVKDSVKAPVTPVLITVKKDTTTQHSLFQNHLLSAQKEKPQLHHTNYDYWITGLFLFLYVLFVWLYTFNRKKLNQVVKRFYITRYANQLSRDELSIGNRVSFFLSIFFILTLTLFISQVMIYYGFHFYTGNIAVLGIVIALIVTIAYSIKFATIKLLGYVFQIQREAADYIMTVFLFCNTLGLFMLPIVMCLTFVKQIPPSIFIYTGMGLIATFILLRVARGILLGLNSSEISKFYLFVYLCTLEILPFVILVKLFTLHTF